MYPENSSLEYGILQPSNSDNRNQGNGHVNSPVDNGKRSLFWDSGKNRPSRLAFVTIIIVVLCISLLGMVRFIAVTHEIRVEIDYEGGWEAGFRINDMRQDEIGTGTRAFTFSMQEGQDISVWVRKTDDGPDRLTVSLFDNDELINERGAAAGYTISLYYTVGEQ
jgi:hypothetical protein